MIRTAEIVNFRGIQSAKLTNLGRINILSGPNGTGKTAFLEGIFLAAGASPEIALRLRQWRGRERELAGTADDIQEAVWADTFRDPALGRARIVLHGDDPQPHALEIRKIGSERAVSLKGEETLLNAGLTFVYDGPGGHHEITPKVTGEKWEFGAKPNILKPHFLAARVNISEAETARTFSRLKMEGKAEVFEKAFLEEFDELKSVGVEAPYGPPALYGTLQSGRTLPLTMISGGISHLAAILVRMVAHPKCIILIDEIENGFYYARYESIWRTLFNLAQLNDSQVFATTHSLECLKALENALPEKASEVRFVRTSMRDHEIAMEEQLSGQALFRALEVGEVR